MIMTMIDYDSNVSKYVEMCAQKCAHMYGYAMLCYALLCSAMLCYALLCYAMLC